MLLGSWSSKWSPRNERIIWRSRGGKLRETVSLERLKSYFWVTFTLFRIGVYRLTNHYWQFKLQYCQKKKSKKKKELLAVKIDK
jgi:hypothetical protein